MEQLYTCKICRRTFSEELEMIKHCNEHIHEKMHACGMCGELFQTAPELETHHAVHVTGKRFSCKDCNQSFSSEYLLKNHAESLSCKFANVCSAKFSCNVCSMKFSLKDLLKIHTQAHDSDDIDKCIDYVVECSELDFGIRKCFVLIETLPLKFEKNNVSESFCNDRKRKEDAGVEEKRKRKRNNCSSFKDAQIKNEIDDELLCPVCHKSFNEVRYLANHSRIHTFEEMSETFAFAQMQKLDESASNTSLISLNQCEAANSSSPSGLLKKNRIRNLKCDTCKKFFSTQIGLKYHKCIDMKRYHKERALKKKLARVRVHKVSDNIKTERTLPRIHACNVCDRKFTHLQALKNHGNLHTGDKPYVCEICDRAYTCWQGLSFHKSRIHSMKNFSCRTCEKTFANKRHYDDHCLIHKQQQRFVCGSCNDIFGTDKYLKIHIRKIHKIYACTECEARFSSKRQQKKHILTFHRQDHNICSTCNKAFMSSAGLARHEGLVHASIFVCKLCYETFDSEEKYRYHISIHKRSCPNSCDVCMTQFKTPKELTAHFEDSKDTDCNHTCKLCNTIFRTIPMLQNHALKHANKPFVCDICNARFQRKVELKKHYYIHTGENPFNCEQCGKGFKERCNYLLHKLTHKGQNPYVCKICGQECVSTSSLARHMITHTNARPYVCDLCGEGFRNSNDLHCHKNLHIDENFYRCDQCNHSFKTANRLRKHKYLHTGQKPFKCSLCISAFAEKQNLAGHYLSHSKEFPNACAICGVECEDRKMLKNHYNVHISRVPTICKTCYQTFSTLGEFLSHRFVHMTPKRIHRSSPNVLNPTLASFQNIEVYDLNASSTSIQTSDADDSVHGATYVLSEDGQILTNLV